MLRQYLLLTAILATLSFIYNSIPPPTFLATAFLIGLTYIPLVAASITIDHSQANLPPTPDPTIWCPKALYTAHALTLTAFFFLAKRDMDLAADVPGGLGRDFDIFIREHRAISVLWTLAVSAAAVGVRESGNWVSFYFVPLVHRCGMLKWDTIALEEAVMAGFRMDELSPRPERDGFL